MNASFQTLLKASLTAIIACLAHAPAPAQADEPAPIQLKAEPGTSVTLNCQTNAIGMDFQPFKTSTGTLTLVLTFSHSPDEAQSNEPAAASNTSDLGTWTASIKTGEHEASLGIQAEKTCANGCTLRETPSGNMELWAPRAVMPSKLEKGATLTLATLDVKSMELKASVLRDKQLSILEKGQCQIATPQADAQSKADSKSQPDSKPQSDAKPQSDDKPDADAKANSTTTTEPATKPQPTTKP